MALSYLTPFTDVRDQMDRLFSDFVEESRFPSLLRPEWPSSSLLKTPSQWMPAIEVSETDTNILVNVALPGMKPEEINLEVTGNTLVLSGEMRREARQDEKQFHRSEFRYGHFMRSIPLPENVKGEACKAEFKNGVLEIVIPKTEVSNRKRIAVKSK